MDKLAVHLIGIGGSGLSSIGKVLLEKGYKVTGSDRQKSPLIQELQKVGVKISIGHKQENIENIDLVIRSSAIPDDNIEILAARASGIPVLKRAQFLSEFLKDYQVISIAGTHGKTTTTAMTAWIFTATGHDPSYVIGGWSHNLKSNAHAGSSDIFIIEADEYDRMFLGLESQKAVITNIEFDHPDCYPTLKDFMTAFIQYATRLKPDGDLVVCSDDSGVLKMLSHVKNRKNIVTYGLGLLGNGSIPTYQGANLLMDQSGNYGFDILRNGQFYQKITLSVVGKHNVLNALASFIVADLCNISPKDIAIALKEFLGTKRRFDIIGKASGIIFIDDYAHHPSEIRATLAAAKGMYPDKRIWAVWQPHTYSRILSLWRDYCLAFKDADRVVLSDVFAARENKPQEFSIHKFAADIKHDHINVFDTLPDIVGFLFKELLDGDVLLVLSAGNADMITRELYSGFQKNIN